MKKHDTLTDQATKTVHGIGIKTVYKEAVREKVLQLKPHLVVFLSEGAGTTDYIRLGGPLLLNQALRSQMITLCLTKLIFDAANDTFNISKRVLDNLPLTIIVSREKISDDSLAALLKLKERYPSTALIVDIDDDLFSISTNHPEFDHYQQRVKVLRQLITAADLVTASTEAVLEGMNAAGASANASIVIPNFLDQRVWGESAPSRKGPHDNIRVLFSGTVTHDADLRLLTDVIPRAQKRVEQEGRHLEMIVVGGTTSEITSMEILSVPERSRMYQPYAAWLQSLDAFDFAIAPLDLENKMNHAKSALKYLEYSAMHLPAIFTAIQPYQDVVTNNANGILISDNDPAAWEDAIVEFALNDEKRLRIAQACYTDLMKNHLLEDHYQEWADAIERASQAARIG